VKVPPELIPATTEAVNMYKEHGGQLTDWPQFGTDPLSDSLSLARSHSFHSHFPSFQAMFEDLVNGHPEKFQNAIQFFRDATYEYCS